MSYYNFIFVILISDYKRITTRKGDCKSGSGFCLIVLGSVWQNCTLAFKIVYFQKKHYHACDLKT